MAKSTRRKSARAAKPGGRARSGRRPAPEPADREPPDDASAAPEPEVTGDDDTGDDDGELLDGEVIDAEVVEDEDLDEDDIAGGLDADDLDAEDIDRALDRELARSSRKRRSEADARVHLIKHDPLSAYVQETKRYPLLSREDEHELAVRLVETGDTDAARRLIEANLRLVVKIAYEYRRAHRNLLDLIQEGNVGLMQAVRKYDPYRGVKLSSYAAWWIRAYILKFILNNWRLVKIGTTQAQRKLFFNLRKEKERLEQLGFVPTPALLAENLDVKEKDVLEMEKRLSAPDASLDAPVGSDDEGGARTRLDFLSDEASDRPDRQVESTQFQSLLRDKLEAFAVTLKGREETIFRERLLTDSPLTLQQIGDRYGVSRERARQLERRLLDKLRVYLEDELGTAVDIGALEGE